MTTPKRPRDPNQLAKFIVDAVTGEGVPPKPAEPKPSQAGGLKGGRARANALTPEQRSQIAAVAAQARWKKT
jgi:hypothetical protein